MKSFDLSRSNVVAVLKGQTDIELYVYSMVLNREESRFYNVGGHPEKYFELRFNVKSRYVLKWIYSDQAVFAEVAIEVITRRSLISPLFSVRTPLWGNGFLLIINAVLLHFPFFSPTLRYQQLREHKFLKERKRLHQTNNQIVLPNGKKCEI